MKNHKMKRIAYVSAIGAAIAMLAACSSPHSQLISGSTRPTLQIVGAAPGALLYVDGTLIGEAVQYDGNNNVLKIEEGMHRISIVKGGTTLHEEKLYAAGGEKKRVEIGGAQP